MKILITGGAGFIGTHIARQLLDSHHEVLIYDNLSHSSINNIDKRALFIQGDLKDEDRLKKILPGVDAVIHMASLIEVAESVKDPFAFAENNILGTIHLLQSMKETGVSKIVFSSSATVYGTPEKLPITENMPITAANPYGATKVSVEAFLAAYHFLYDFDVIILRYFNPYGPGENHQPESHAIPNFIKAALGKKPIPLYWNGEQVRDFIYVEDLARAHIAPLELIGFQTFNVGTEKGVKIIDVVRKIEQIVGYPLKVQDLGERAGDVAANYASSKKLQEATGWQPRVDIDEGLKRTVDWFKGNVK